MNVLRRCWRFLHAALRGAFRERVSYKTALELHLPL